MTAPELSSPTTDHAAAERFLRAIDPNAGRFHLRSFAEQAGSIGAANYHATPAEVSELLESCAASGHGLFVVVNEGGHKAADVSRVRALFLDIDADKLPAGMTAEAAARWASSGRRSKDEKAQAVWPLASAVVQTGNGWHVYWLVKDCPLERFTAAQKALAAKFHGDPAVCDLPRVMRLPGSVHQKGAPKPVTLAVCKRDGRTYSLDDLLKRLGVALEVTPEIDNFTRVVAAAKRCDADPNTDPVLAYLRAHPEYLKPGGRRDARAPVDVVCPNADNHSQPDGLTSTVYMPHGAGGKPRGFHCSHGHCLELTLRKFLLHIGYESECPSLETDDGIACRFVSWLDGKVMHSRSQWHVFTGSHWKPDKNAVERFEPPRESRRLVGVSHAAMASSRCC